MNWWPMNSLPGLQRPMQVGHSGRSRHGRRSPRRCWPACPWRSPRSACRFPNTSSSASNSLRSPARWSGSGPRQPPRWSSWHAEVSQGGVKKVVASFHKAGTWSDSWSIATPRSWHRHASGLSRKLVVKDVPNCDGSWRAPCAFL